MKKSRYTEEQIAFALKQNEIGTGDKYLLCTPHTALGSAA